MLIRKAVAANKLNTDPETKYILTWCEAYGGLTYMWQFGAGKFLEAGCPETRCYLTSDRNLLGSVADFDAILFHQVSCDWWTADGAGHVTSVLLSDWSLAPALGEAAGRARGAAAGAALRALDVRVARPPLLRLHPPRPAQQLLQLEHELQTGLYVSNSLWKIRAGGRYLMN